MNRSAAPTSRGIGALRGAEIYINPQTLNSRSGASGARPSLETRVCLLMYSHGYIISHSPATHATQTNDMYQRIRRSFEDKQDELVRENMKLRSAVQELQSHLDHLSQEITKVHPGVAAVARKVLCFLFVVTLSMFLLSFATVVIISPYLFTSFIARST